MSLHQCLFVSKSACQRSRNNLPPSSSPALGGAPVETTVLPDTVLPDTVLPVWSHRAVSILIFLLLPALTSGCTLRRISAPKQIPVVSAQAAERAPTPAPSASEASTTDAPELAAEVSSEPSSPEPPRLMSQASSTAIKATAPPADQGVNQGPLRLGNQTPHPLRIAFLSQGQPLAENLPASAQPDGVQADNAQALGSETSRPEADDPERENTVQEPFHWDFAPEEGGRDGLLLALPERDLVLQNGDVVVAFAQDGSQRYWGPYVVGQTSLPHWNSDRQEWQLLVQP